MVVGSLIIIVLGIGIVIFIIFRNLKTKPSANQRETEKSKAYERTNITKNSFNESKKPVFTE